MGTTCLHANSEARGSSRSGEGGRRRPHPFRHPRQGSQASHRTAEPHPILRLPDAIVEKGNGAYAPTALDCARRIAGIPALGRLCEDSERGGSRNVGAAKVGAGTAPDETICNVFASRTNSQWARRAARPFGGSIGCGAVGPTAARQDAAAHVANEPTTLAMAFLGLQKIAARPETRRARPLDKGRGGSVYPLPSRWQATGCFSTRVDAGEPFVRDCGLDSQNFTLEPDGAMVLDARGAEDGEGGSPPHLAARQGTRAGRARHHKVVQGTSTQRKAHES
ncbi:hypothetical protein TcYC6_0082440 [Trypanosoma cruzi]|nr:hypothetical protein TcYC6_0082440 [Trypanosoma cruzi]